jgi:hypothetical protein
MFTLVCVRNVLRIQRQQPTAIYIDAVKIWPLKPKAAAHAVNNIALSTNNTVSGLLQQVVL